MKTIKLSFNQSKNLMWNNKQVKVRQNGMALYLNYYGDKIIATDWLGQRVNVKIQIDECFE